jgi:hypothetical protein
LSLPNVVSVGVGWKYKGDEATNRLCITVFVERKVGISGRGRIPTRLRAVSPKDETLPYYIPTDVYESPADFSALALGGGTRIARAGIGSGVVGVAYTSVGVRRPVFVTASHVAARYGTTAFGKPIKQVGTNAPIGRIIRMTSVFIQSTHPNRFDAAVVLMEPDVDFMARQIDQWQRLITGYGRIAKQTNDVYYYYAGNFTYHCRPVSRISQKPIKIQHAGRVAEFIDCWVLKVEKGVPVPGHSGSVLCSVTQGKVLGCGLLIAGSSDKRLVVATDLRPTVSYLSTSKCASDGATAEDVHIAWDHL